MNLKHLKNDIPASLVVFLVALPLCLGIALASGAPLMSGIISGIIGGVVVTIISESHVSVSGPAAGLATMVAASIKTLGAFDIFLLAVVIAGAFQLLCGIFKAGFIANFVPNNVIKGLLAAIGIILIMKQIPHAVGLDKDYEADFSFFQADGKNTITELFSIFEYFTWGAVVISGVGLLLLIFWDKTPLKKLTWLPPSLVVVLSGIIMNAMFTSSAPTLALQAEHLVKLPIVSNAKELIAMPKFSAITNYQVWLVAAALLAVASLETLLNLEAVENLDPQKRSSSPNRELVAQGVGNMISGLIGGLPITSVIVRSSVNINSGNKTKLSALLHGIMLLISLLFAAKYMNLIPLASLAAILLFTGYKLAKVQLFKDMFAKGWNQFIPFVVTILAIYFTDLLKGVFIGLGVSIFYLLKSNYKNPFTLEKEHAFDGEIVKLELATQATFLNKATIKNLLWNVKENGKVSIDATYCTFIDQDVEDTIVDFLKSVAKDKNILVNLKGFTSTKLLKDQLEF